MKKILVITDVPDPHMDLVSPYLKDSRLVVFNSALFPDGTDINYSITPGDPNLRITSEGRDFADVCSVWFRKPKYLNRQMLKAMGVPSDYHDFTIGNHEAAVTALYDLLDDRLWVSKVVNLKRASNKVLQLQVANSLGLIVPATLVTSSPTEAEKFRQRYGDVAVKSIHLPSVKLKGQNHLFPTTLVKAGDYFDLSGIGLAPAIIQEVIRTDLDIRVTVVGHEMFACAIRRKRGSKELDYRAGVVSHDLEYQVVSLSQDIKDKLLQMLDIFGLKFGAFDLILDTQGRYVFVEVNPNGQWGWIEEYTGMPIARSLAELLESC